MYYFVYFCYHIICFNHHKNTFSKLYTVKINLPPNLTLITLQEVFQQYFSIYQSQALLLTTCHEHNSAKSISF